MAEVEPFDGATRLAAVIGSPVRHSRSPAILNAAFRAAGIHWAFLAFEVVEAEAAAAVGAMRSLGLGGLSVTMPLKEAVIPALDGLSEDAAALRAVNCVAWDGDRLVGHNTDGAGLVRSLSVDHGIEVAGRSCVVLGAGGAARSVVRSLARAGAASVSVVNRTPERAEVAAALADGVGRVAHPDAIESADLVVNATSVGMGANGDDQGPSPVAEGLLHEGQVVVDLVYLPLRTPLLAQAEAAGARPVDGLGMLVHQAAISMEHWTGVRADVGVMREAALAP